MRFRKEKSLLYKRRTIWEKMFFGVMFLVLLTWAALVICMLAWSVISSLKTNLEYVNSPLGLPAVLQFQNYAIAMEKLSVSGVGFVGMLWNSLWRSVGSTLLSVTMVCITGYIFAQYEFKGKEFIFSVVIFTMIIPIYGSFAAHYKLTYDMGLENSYLYLIKSLGGLGGNMLLTYGYFKGVPRELREAIYVDGGSDYTAFFKVYFPLARNVFIALALLGFIGHWNDYETALLYFDKMPDLALGLFNFKMEIEYVANNPAFFAGALIVMSPVVILFIFASDKIMGQLYSGGLKG